MIRFVRNFLNSGHHRSVTAKKNILALVFIRGFSILISLLLVPLTIHYVNASTYGIWLILSSIIAWISSFDVGLNNGLRNKFDDAKAYGIIGISLLLNEHHSPLITQISTLIPVGRRAESSSIILKG